MKTITPEMKVHLSQGASTLTTCWNITRADGARFFYTELDEDIEFDGNIYRSAAGFNKSSINSSATFAVDKLEVTGFLRDDGISDDEIRNGAFDYAKVEVFMINYMDTSMGIIKLRSGFFGEVRTTTSGAFMVELRGLVDLLQTKIGNTYLPECRLDLGDTKCGIKLVADERKGGTVYAVGDRIVFPSQNVAYVPPRHYPELLDPNEGNWLDNRVQADLICTPKSGKTYMVGLDRDTTADDTAGKAVTLASLGISGTDVSTESVKVTFELEYFSYFDGSDGFIEISTQRLVTGSVYLNIDTVRTDCLRGLPGRRWRKASATVTISDDTDRFVVRLGTYGAPNARKDSSIRFDNLDIIVEKVETVNTSFVDYAGVEYQCTTAGKTATTAPTFSTTIGDEVADGSVIWQCSHPRWTFLREVTSDMVSTSLIEADPVISVDPDEFFEWGVVKFLTGDNAGRAMEVMLYGYETGQIRLALPLPYQAVAGDLFSIQAGCNKTARVCRDRFANIVNFRGHPRVPGQGQYFKVAGIS